MSLNRHDWVWLNADWDGYSITDDVAAHHGLGLPFVVARKSPCDDPESVNLGFVSPQKQRQGFTVIRQQIQRTSAALPLSQAIPSAPHFWQPILCGLDKTLSHLQVYGSLAWQCVTGKTHMTTVSDVDLLFYPQSISQLESGIKLLVDYRMNGINLDGEIVFPDGAAVSWLEWSKGQNPVLAKSMKSVGLWDRAVLLKAFIT